MIHQYKLNNLNIVLDTLSGGIHVVDDVMYDIISMYERKHKEDIFREITQKYANTHKLTQKDIEECFEDIENLIEQKQLFTKNEYEDIAREFKTGVIKAMCLHVAHTCNLNCSYCFAAQGKYNGEDALMSFEVGKRALDFLMENSGTRRNLEVDFFGGEPLLNMDVVKKLVKYARDVEQAKGKNFRFTLTTNGVLLNEDTMDFLNEHMHNVVLSLDGRKEIHDYYRKNLAGEGSYDKILPKFREFIKRRRGEGYYIRGTYTHANVNFMQDVIHMADLGFDKLSMEPVVCDENDEAALTAEDAPILFNEYEKLAIEMIKRQKEGNPFEFYHYILDLQNGPCVYKRITGCGSGTEYIAVTPSGNIFPCHQFVGEDEFLMGNIWDGISKIELQKSFGKCTIYSRKECRECWANMYCSGGCAANGYHATGDINGVYEYGCELFKKRMECAVMMHVSHCLQEEEE